MTRDEAASIVALPKEQAIDAIVALGEKAEKYDQLRQDASPTCPSGMTPPYLKPACGKRRKKPGRKKGHPGAARRKPEKIDHCKEHTLESCPNCHRALQKSTRNYKRYTQDLPPIEPQVTEHTVNGYWCSHCKKMVYAKVTDALPNAMVGLRVIVFTAWLHYLVGMSVSNIVKLLSIIADFSITAGGLTQAWKNLAASLEPLYEAIGQKVRNAAVLHADETGWRINGNTHWLWCFATKTLCYYVIDKTRGSPLIKRVLGTIFSGILICDFWGAYNKISTLAKQRCFYHLFTELDKVAKKKPSTAWKAFSKKLSRLLMDAIRLSEKKGELASGTYHRRTNKLHTRLQQLIEATYADNDAKRIQKRLKRHRNELFTFLEFDNVSPYNNHAEQQMRKPVITRKISQQNRSDQGAKTHAILMTLFKSAELQKLNPVEAVLADAKTVIKATSQDEINFKIAA